MLHEIVNSDWKTEELVSISDRPIDIIFPVTSRSFLVLEQAPTSNVGTFLLGKGTGTWSQSLIIYC